MTPAATGFCPKSFITAHPADQSLFVAFSENPINQRFIGSVDRQEKATKRDKNINGSAGWAVMKDEYAWKKYYMIYD